MSNDPVNHPPHYTFGKYEVIDVLEDWFATEPLLWQAGKYLARATRKGRLVEDLQKAVFYINRRISSEPETVAAGADFAYMNVDQFRDTAEWLVKEVNDARKIAIRLSRTSGAREDMEAYKQAEEWNPQGGYNYEP